jgi:micrococcal nuclease
VTDAVVVRVVDGDTVALTGGEKIRIRGLDTPETRKPGVPVQCFGPEATAYARQQLLGRRVRLVTDPGDLRDRYGRLVAEVWVDGRSYAEDAVRAGEGRAYLYSRRHPASNWADIEAAQREAQAGHKGLWGACPTR